MKKIILFLAAFYVFSGYAQNVGIGTASPDAKALLDISSISKGVLFPRMTTAQRFAISTPPAGLMVYDTERKCLYQHDGSIWRIILNNDYWNRISTNSNYINNLTDSIAIGTITPQERLDVNGNIRSRNNLLADNNINASGNITGGGFLTGGNILAAGTSLLSGDVTTNSDVIINNTAATMQLKSNSINKGYFQLSGDNVRLGTNSGNPNGKIIIRMNGTDKIEINPAGNINVPGKITSNATSIGGGTNPGAFSLIPFAMGVINNDGSVGRVTDNVTVEFFGTSLNSQYSIISVPGIHATSLFMVTSAQKGMYPSAAYHAPGQVKVLMEIVYPDASTGTRNTGYSFVIYN